MINNVVAHIKEQIGLEVKLCDHFTGLHENNGKVYFNIVTEKPLFESVEMPKLINLASYSSKIVKVEENGYKRIAIFIK